MKRTWIYLATLGAVLLIPLVLFLRTFSPSPLPEPAPYSGLIPTATPPKDSRLRPGDRGKTIELRPSVIAGGRCSSSANFRWPEPL